MDNKGNKCIFYKKFIIWIGCGLIGILIGGAYVNYVHINNRVQTAIENTQTAIDSIQTTINNIRATIEETQKTIDVINEKDSIVKIKLSLDKVRKETQDRQGQIFIDYSTRIKDLNKGIIDSNVLTFLFTVLLLFSGGFLIYIQTEIKEQIDDSKKQVIESQEHITESEKHIAESEKDISVAKKMLSRLDVEQTTIELYTQIHALQVFSTNTQCSLAANNYLIVSSTNKLFYELFNMTENLLRELQDDKYKFITKNWEKVFNDIFERMIYAFEIDRIRKNPENAGKTQPVEKVIDKIEELRNKVLGLKGID